MLKAPFVLEIFTFFSWPPDYEEKQLNKKFKVDFKVYDVTDWTTNICNICIFQYLKKQRQSDKEIWAISKILSENYFR